ncbi:MAG: hypothetical protein K8U57_12075 [Planctomycetes bacterium]|nr:hypothetical protein [Planctomycetota bacterium]
MSLISVTLMPQAADVVTTGVLKKIVGIGIAESRAVCTLFSMTLDLSQSNATGQVGTQRFTGQPCSQVSQSLISPGIPPFPAARRQWMAVPRPVEMREVFCRGSRRECRSAVSTARRRAFSVASVQIRPHALANNRGFRLLGFAVSKFEAPL